MKLFSWIFAAEAEWPSRERWWETPAGIHIAAASFSNCVSAAELGSCTVFLGFIRTELAALCCRETWALCKVEIQESALGAVCAPVPVFQPRAELQAGTWALRGLCGLFKSSEATNSLPCSWVECKMPDFSTRHDPVAPRNDILTARTLSWGLWVSSSSLNFSGEVIFEWRNHYCFDFHSCCFPWYQRNIQGKKKKRKKSKFFFFLKLSASWKPSALSSKSKMYRWAPAQCPALFVVPQSSCKSWVFL